jgi:hypothetical protein
VHVSLSCGVGNRLFKYASAKGIAAKLGCKFNVIDVSVDTEHQRVYDWLVKRIASDVDVHHPAIGERCMVYNQPDAEHIGVETDLTSLRKCADTCDHILLNGYFQSEANFANIKNELRELLCPETPAVAAALDSRYQNARSWVAIHVRIGDYIKDKYAHEHFINLQAYYERCITALRHDIQQGLRLHFLIICEDADNIPHVYPDLLPFIARENAYTIACTPPDKDIDPVEFDLYLLARCAGVICSNSTFAWWGAWIGQNRDKDVQRTRVFVPDKWLNGNPHIVGMSNAKVI